MSRQYRITASRAYALYTYNNNNSGKDWQQKSIKYFFPRKFSNKYTEHGIISEPAARKKYSMLIESDSEVVETGLIICQKDPWLGVT